MQNTNTTDHSHAPGGTTAHSGRTMPSVRVCGLGCNNEGVWPRGQGYVMAPPGGGWLLGGARTRAVDSVCVCVCVCV